MPESLKLWTKRLLARFGLELRPVAAIPEAGPRDRELIETVRPFTMTSLESLWSTVISVRHVVRNQVAGAFVECGVWRGGQSALAARVFQSEHDVRDLWLFDTFAGMTAPTAADVNLFGQSSLETFRRHQKGDVNTWAYASLPDVRKVMESTGYPSERVHFVEGPVETTLRAGHVPERIAVLRLDTDWYESTKVELEILYPRLAPGGVLIVDDYGHYAGARQAVDEYFAAQHVFPLLQPIDYSGRILVRV